ncbi:MAG: 5-(carboxyamino)imidazole ribonucleotide mutase [Bacteroidetes bacterium]|nr:5-(carboxyamino)imidazole ribonucleotide mutase [Bacteroidota bacterium]
MEKIKVGIIMGSDSDLPIMNAAIDICKEFGIETEVKIISAHRTPDDLALYAKTAHICGVSVIIAGAGGAAHLPGVIAAYTPLPVIGVPIQTNTLNGLDSLFSIVQMPSGVPVATVAINGAKNAALLAMQIIGISNKKIQDKFVDYKKTIAEESRNKNQIFDKKK